MKKIRFLNPYIFLSMGLLITFLAYNIGWSTIYPPLSDTMIFFLIFFMVILGIFGICLLPFFESIIEGSKKNKLPYSKMLLNVLLIFIYLGTIADGLYSKGFPILGQVLYNTFGVPILHPITVILSIFLTIYSTQLYCSYELNKKRSLRIIVLSFGPSLLAFSRGVLILSIIIVATIYLYNRVNKIGIKTVLALMFSLIVGAFIFGIAGNYRFNNQMGLDTTDPFDSSLIYQLGSANNKVSNKSICSPLFWTYIYLTSPMANLESAVDNNLTLNNNENSVGKYVVTQFTPDVISTKIYPDYKNQVQINGYNNRVSVGLTVSTAFYESFIQLGWIGIMFMSIVFLLFPIIYLYIIYRIQPGFAIIGMALLDCLYLLALFDNPWPFSGISVQLLLILIMSFFWKKRKS